MALVEGTVFDGTNSERLSKELPTIFNDSGNGYYAGFYSGNLIGVHSDALPNLKFQTGNTVPVWICSAGLGGILSIYSAFVKKITFVGSPDAFNLSNDDANMALAGMPGSDR